MTEETLRRLEGLYWSIMERPHYITKNKIATILLEIILKEKEKNK